MFFVASKHGPLLVDIKVGVILGGHKYLGLIRVMKVLVPDTINDSKT